MYSVIDLLKGPLTRGFTTRLLLTAVLIGCSSDNPSIDVTTAGTARSPGVLAITHVNVIPMDSERTLTNQTVIVRSGRIDRIGPAGQVSVPGGADEIDGNGRYLIPGLMDMHVHHYGDARELEQNRRLFLAHGVTTVRHMWGDPVIISERDAIRSGQAIGPRIIAASPGMDGAGGRWEYLTPSINTVEEARAAVERAAAENYDFIKVYTRLDSTVFDATVEAARVHNMPVAGHIPTLVGYEKALAAGMTSAEHLLEFRRKAGLSKFDEFFDEDRARELARAYAAAGIWVVATVWGGTRTTPELDEIKQMNIWRFTGASQKDFWSRQFSVQERTEVAFISHKKLLQILHGAGVNLMMGTDAGSFYIVYGYSMWGEMDRFSRVGLTPFQVLRSATVGPATYLKMENELGQVRPGYLADLALLDENPLDDISAIRTIVGVVVQGRWLTRSHLMQQLESGL